MLLLFGSSLVYTSIVLLGLDRGSIIGKDFVTMCKVNTISVDHFVIFLTKEI